MRVTTIAVVIGLVWIAIMTVTPIVHASIIGDFGIGYNQGKIDANSDWYAGRTMSDTCPYSGVSATYSAGYTAGYLWAWNGFSASQP